MLDITKPRARLLGLPQADPQTGAIEVTARVTSSRDQPGGRHGLRETAGEAAPPVDTPAER